MAFLHIPTRYEDPWESMIDDLLDFTFPPIRYQSTNRSALPFWDDKSYPFLKRDVEGKPRCVQSRDAGDKFLVSLDVKHYKPEEIHLKVEDNKLVVSGKHHHQGEEGFESSEFQRSYQLSDDVDQRTLTSKISPDGVLVVQAEKKANFQLQQQQQKPGRQEGLTQLFSGGLTQNDDNYTVSVATGDYKPEEITIKVNGRQLVIEGQHKAQESGEHGKQVHHLQFYRSFTLPKDGDMDGIESRMQRDGTLVVNIPRNAALLPQERVVPISFEESQGSQEKEGDRPEME